MKKKLLTTLTVSLLSLPFLAFAGQKLLISGQGWSEVGIIDKDNGQIEWAYSPKAPAQTAKAKKAKASKHRVGINCVNLAKDGNIAFSTGFGAMVVSKDKEVVWSYDAKPDQELHYISQLENGNYLLGLCGLPSLILELDKDKNVVNKIAFDSENSNVHSQFRHITPLKNGNYLVALLKSSRLIELSKEGKVLGTYPLKGIMPSAIFGVCELKNGNLIVSGEAGQIIEYNRQKNAVIRTINNENLKGAQLLFACQVKELKNGNLLVANWNGHSKDKTQPKLLEIDKDNNVVWKLENSERIKNLAAVDIME